MALLASWRTIYKSQGRESKSKLSENYHEELGSKKSSLSLRNLMVFQLCLFLLCPYLSLPPLHFLSFFIQASAETRISEFNSRFPGRRTWLVHFIYPWPSFLWWERHDLLSTHQDVRHDLLSTQQTTFSKGDAGIKIKWLIKETTGLSGTKSWQRKPLPIWFRSAK